MGGWGGGVTINQLNCILSNFLWVPPLFDILPGTSWGICQKTTRGGRTPTSSGRMDLQPRGAWKRDKLPTVTSWSPVSSHAHAPHRRTPLKELRALEPLLDKVHAPSCFPLQARCRFAPQLFSRPQESLTFQPQHKVRYFSFNYSDFSSALGLMKWCECL